MDSPSPDQLVCNDHWSDLRQFRELPSIDTDAFDLCYLPGCT